MKKKVRIRLIKILAYYKYHLKFVELMNCEGAKYRKVYEYLLKHNLQHGMCYVNLSVFDHEEHMEILPLFSPFLKRKDDDYVCRTPINVSDNKDVIKSMKKRIKILEKLTNM